MELPSLPIKQKLKNCRNCDDLLCFIDELEPEIGYFGGRRFYIDKQTDSICLNDIIRQLNSINLQENVELIKNEKILAQIQWIDEQANLLLEKNNSFRRIFTVVKQFFSNLFYDRHAIIHSIEQRNFCHLKRKIADYYSGKIQDIGEIFQSNFLKNTKSLQDLINYVVSYKNPLFHRIYFLTFFPWPNEGSIEKNLIPILKKIIENEEIVSRQETFFNIEGNNYPIMDFCLNPKNIFGYEEIPKIYQEINTNNALVLLTEGIGSYLRTKGKKIFQELNSSQPKFGIKLTIPPFIKNDLYTDLIILMFEYISLNPMPALLYLDIPNQIQEKLYDDLILTILEKNPLLTYSAENCLWIQKFFMQENFFKGIHLSSFDKQIHEEAVYFLQTKHLKKLSLSELINEIEFPPSIIQSFNNDYQCSLYKKKENLTGNENTNFSFIFTLITKKIIAAWPQNKPEIIKAFQSIKEDPYRFILLARAILLYNEENPETNLPQEDFSPLENICNFLEETEWVSTNFKNHSLPLLIAITLSESFYSEYQNVWIPLIEKTFAKMEPIKKVELFTDRIFDKKPKKHETISPFLILGIHQFLCQLQEIEYKQIAKKETHEEIDEDAAFGLEFVLSISPQCPFSYFAPLISYLAEHPIFSLVSLQFKLVDNLQEEILTESHMNLLLSCVKNHPLLQQIEWQGNHRTKNIETLQQAIGDISLSRDYTLSHREKFTQEANKYIANQN